jgi:hypothetical protein
VDAKDSNLVSSDPHHVQHSHSHAIEIAIFSFWKLCVNSPKWDNNPRHPESVFLKYLFMANNSYQDKVTKAQCN